MHWVLRAETIKKKKVSEADSVANLSSRFNSGRKMVDDTPAITYTRAASVEKHSTCTQASSFIHSHGVRGQTVVLLSR